MKAYFFNKKDELQKVIGEKNFIEAHLIEQINNASQLVFSLKKPLAISIQYVCIPSPNEDGFLMFKILTEEIKDSTIEYTCIEAAYNELASYGYVQDIRPNSRSARYMLEQVLQGTRWELGTIYDNSTNATTNFYYEPVLSCIQDIVDIFGLELTFTVGITGNQITARRVNLYRQQGNRTGKRFEYGSNALEVAQETSTDELYTALVGRGKGEQVDGDNNPDTLDGYGRRITFADIEWKKTAGKPLDKPKGQEYLEDPDATKLYGFSDGKPRIGIVTFEDDEDKDVLIQHTYEKLQEVKRPKVQFKASVIDVGDCTLGDTVAIIRHDFQIEYMTRIFKINHDLLDENNNTIELGDDLSGQDIVSKVNDVSSKLSDTQKQVSYVATTADGQHKVNYSATKPNTAKNGDLWYKDLGNGETELYIYNDGWQFVMSTKDTHEISDKVDAAMAEAEQAKQDAADAVKKADDAVDEATGAHNAIADVQADIDTAKSDSATALQQAKDAMTKAQQALDGIGEGVDLSGIQKQIDDVNTSLGTVSSDLDTAKKSLDDVAKTAKANGESIVSVTKDVSGLKTDVADTQGNVSQVVQQAQELSTAITNAKGDISKLQQTATALTSSIKDNAGDITSLKQTATKLSSDMKDAQGNISSIQQTTTDLSSTVGNLQAGLSDTNKKVSSQGTQITQNKKDIESKANQTDVDAVTKRVMTAETSIKQNAKDITSKASQSDVNTLTGRVKTAESNITQNANNIKSKVTSSDVQGMLDKGGYATQKWTGSEIDQKAGEISQTVSTVSNKIDNLQIGARNLIAGTSDDWQEASTATSEYGTILVHDITDKVEKGKTYTYQLYKGGTTHSGHISVAYYDKKGGTVLGTHNGDEVSFSYQGKLSVTFTVADTAGYVETHGFIYSASYSGTNKLRWKQEQLESGTVATDWTPAPEDTASVDALSKVDQKADSIQETVKTKADQSTVTQLATVVDSKVNSSDYNSEISQMKDNINLSVRVGSADKSNLVLNGSFANEQYWNFGSISTRSLGSSGNSPVSSSTYIRLHPASDSVSFLQKPTQRVLNAMKNEKVTFSAYARESIKRGSVDIYIVTTDSTGAKSYFNSDKNQALDTGWQRYSFTAQMPADIASAELRFKLTGLNNVDFYITGVMLSIGDVLLPYAESDLGLVNQINVSEEGILIDGNKVHITGQTSIDDAVIKSAMIDTINASKITAGTLNAANVNLINVNVNSLVGNTTNFVQSAWNSINSSIVINGDGIRISGDWGLNIYNDWGIKSYAYDADKNLELVGNFSSTHMEGYPDLNGTMISADAGGDFIGIGYRDSTADNFKAALTFFRTERAEEGYHKGLNMIRTVYFKDNIGATGTSTEKIAVATGNFNNHDYIYMGNSTGKSGFAYGGSFPFLVVDGIAYKMGGWSIPTKINSDGTVASYFKITGDFAS